MRLEVLVNIVVPLEADEAQGSFVGLFMVELIGKTPIYYSNNVTRRILSLVPGYRRLIDQ